MNILQKFFSPFEPRQIVNNRTIIKKSFLLCLQTTTPLTIHMQRQFKQIRKKSSNGSVAENDKQNAEKGDADSNAYRGNGTGWIFKSD